MEKEDVITLEDGRDYVIYDKISYYGEVYYLVYQIIDDEVSDDTLIVKEISENSLEIVLDEELLSELKLLFLKDWSLDVFEGTPHIEAKKGEIAPLVIMPGDPVRAKNIAEKYLVNYELVSDVRGILAYTGLYKDTLVTIMAAGMGMPSAGIYYHELFKFYNVSKIIRIGTCGASFKEGKLMDIIVADKAFTSSNFAETYTGKVQNITYPTKELNDNIISYCNEHNVKCHIGGVLTMDFFGPYIDTKHLYDKIPEGFNLKGEEMECFGLFLIANSLEREAACILTIVDSPYQDEIISSEQREAGLDQMAIVALDAIIK